MSVAGTTYKASVAMGTDPTFTTFPAGPQLPD